MHPMVCHATTTGGPIERIEASVVATPDGCRAVFGMHGNLADVKIPDLEASAGRFDNLWQTTCFEIFWQAVGSAQYREFNLSPSTRWACYDFDDFRRGMRNAEAGVTIVRSVETGKLSITADIRSELPVPARVALNAIVEDGAGRRYFWALAFADGVPEFHSEACRALRITRGDQ